MPWQEITFELSSVDAEIYEDSLLALGALSVTLRDAQDQPLLEPEPGATPLWDRLLLTAMFDMEVDANRVLVELPSLVNQKNLPHHRLEILKDQEWRRTWMEYFKPMRFGRRLWILPSGYDPIGDADAVVIDLDPGLAFGTGSHPTTALCLNWLDANDAEGKTVVDYGCGSGILAIAAAKLGASKVIAIDNDPQALQATNMNAKNNGVDHVIQTCMPGEKPALSADILIANILLGPLLTLHDVFSALTAKGGALVMSGILDQQQDELKQIYQVNFDFHACEKMEDWVRLDAIHKA